MVTVTDFYLIKFQYIGVDQATGDMKKKKQEILAECANYTDAEKLAFAYIHDEEMDKYEPCKPEIVRQKVNDIRINGCVIIEQDLFNGFAEMYLETDDFRFYQVNANDPYENDEGDTKNVKRAMYIPASSTGEAENYALRLYPDATITSTKIVNFKSAFLIQSTIDSLKRDFENM